MTVQEAIRWVDEKKHNVYSVQDKLLWLTRAEAMVRQLELRYGKEQKDTALTLDASLSLPCPYDSLYLHWLEAQIDYNNREYISYNNSMAMFNALWSEFAGQYCRTHLGKLRQFRL